MKTIIIPTGGLGNRMRAIASGLVIAEHYNSPVEVRWNLRDGLNAEFLQLFLPIDSPTVKVDTNKAWLYNIEFRKEYLLRYPLLKLRHSRILYNYNMYEKGGNSVFHTLGENFKGNLLLVSGNAMCDGYDMKKLFVPSEEIQKYIAKVTAAFSDYTVGVHIRRTDNLQSIKHSPLDLFYSYMEKEIQANENVKFYIATDDEEVKRVMEEKFPQRIITQSGDVKRNSLEGMKFAVNELFCLSKTKKIIGSVFSSYSQIASELGHIPIEYARSAK